MALLSVMAVAMITATATAATWWVDDDNYNAGYANAAAYIAAGYDGTTAEKAFGSIQIAVDKAASGDTINVKAGVYDKGGMVNTTGDIKSRVRVFDKQLHLVAVDGKENTFIVGASDPTGAADGRGPNAVRCVIVAGTGSDGTVIEGFTICGGRTDSEIDSTSANNGKGFGAGVYDRRGQRKTYVVDCVISNCVACNGGGLTQGTAYRTLIENCHATRWGGASQASSLHTCIIAHCGGADAVCNSLGKAINCTFVANTSGLYYNGDTQFYNCIVAGSGKDGIWSKEQGLDAATCTKTSTHGYHQVMAPAFGDYRPIEGNHALTMGNPEYLDDITIPGYTLGVNMTDFEGNLYPLASAGGTIAAGAIQTAATPAGGVLQFNDCTNGVVIAGVAAKSGDYLYPEAYPTQYNVKVLEAEGQHLFCLARDTNDGGRLHPQMDDTFWLMPPPETTRASTNTALFATAAFWCDANNGSDSNAGTTNAPFKSIQKAVDACGSSVNTVIFAAEGDYNIGADGALGKIHASTHPLTNRVYIASTKYVFIRGAGAGKSFITGAKDPVSGADGTGVIRPVASQSTRAAVQGFTLRGAGTYYESENTGASFMTTGAFAGQPGTHLLDCTVTGNSGSGAVVFNAKVERCLIVGNTTRNYVVHGNSSSANPIVSSVVVDNCVGSYYVAVGYAQCVNVTARGKSNLSQLVVHNSTVMSWASIFDTGRWAAQSDDNTRHTGLLAWNLQNSVVPSGSTYADPLFCTADATEYRVIKSSPAYTCGVVPTSTNYGADYWKYAGGDVNGKRLVFTDGKPMSGACHTTATVDLYVDGTTGNDGNDGKTPTSAKKTIAAALAGGVPSDAVGATVHVAAGTYKEGSATPSGWDIAARALVPAGVTLEGAGAETTFIVGARATTGADSFGRGNDAVHCVYLNPGATVKGFTLTGGATKSGFSDNNAVKTDYHGAGACGAAMDAAGVAASRVEDCIVSNCVAACGGAGYGVTFVRSRLIKCRAVRGSATEKCGLENTIVDEMDSDSGAGICVNNSFPIVNATIGPNIRKDGGTGAALYYQSTSAGGLPEFGVVNTVILGSVTFVTAMTNCVSTSAIASAPRVNCRQCTAAEIALDDKYRPDRATSVLVDQGLADVDCGETDVYGGQRVYNAAIDIGAVEANWCDKYAADISGKRRLAVTAASPDVVESAGIVTLPEGTTLDAQWTNEGTRSLRYTVQLRLAADSSATVTLNGEPLASYSAAGTYDLEFDNANAVNDLAFTCTSGTAEILSSQCERGVILILR